MPNSKSKFPKPRYMLSNLTYHPPVEVEQTVSLNAMVQDVQQENRTSYFDWENAGIRLDEERYEVVVGVYVMAFVVEVGTVDASYSHLQVNIIF